MGVAVLHGQLSLFDIINEHKDIAVCCWDDSRLHLQQAESWMKRLIPDGEYVVIPGDHPLVLKPTALTRADIPKGHEYYHYLIGNLVYAGTFIGGPHYENENDQ